MKFFTIATLISAIVASNRGFYRRGEGYPSSPAPGSADEMAILRQMVNSVGSGAQHVAGMSDDQVNAIRQAMAFAEGGAPSKPLSEENAKEPAAIIPGVPAIPAIPEVSATPAIPDTSAIPDVSAIPTIPTIPEVSAIPAIPGTSAIPSVPAIPAIPDVSAAPVAPTSPSDSQDKPKEPTPPATPANAGLPSIHGGPQFNVPSLAPVTSGLPPFIQGGPEFNPPAPSAGGSFNVQGGPQFNSPQPTPPSNEQAQVQNKPAIPTEQQLNAMSQNMVAVGAQNGQAQHGKPGQGSQAAGLDVNRDNRYGYGPFNPYGPYNPYGFYGSYNPYNPYNPYGNYNPYGPYGPIPFRPYA